MHYPVHLLSLEYISIAMLLPYYILILTLLLQPDTCIVAQ